MDKTPTQEDALKAVRAIKYLFGERAKCGEYFDTLFGFILAHPQAPAAEPAGERKGFEVELSPEQEGRFSTWVGVAEMSPWVRSVARLALLLNTTNRGLIDYAAAQHFANELVARAALTPEAAHKAGQGEVLGEGG